MRTLLMHLDGALCGPGPLRPRWIVVGVDGMTGVHIAMHEVVFMSKRNAHHWISTVAVPDLAYVIAPLERDE